MPEGAGWPPALYARPADMVARFGLQELIALAPLPESEALDACGPPVFSEKPAVRSGQKGALALHGTAAGLGEVGARYGGKENLSRLWRDHGI